MITSEEENVTLQLSHLANGVPSENQSDKTQTCGLSDKDNTKPHNKQKHNLPPAAHRANGNATTNGTARKPKRINSALSRVPTSAL